MSTELGLALAAFGASCVAAGMVPGVLLGKHVAQDSSRRALDRVASMIDGVLDRGVVDERQLPASDRSYGFRRLEQPSVPAPAPRPARGSDADLRDLEPYDQERPGATFETADGRTWRRP